MRRSRRRFWKSETDSDKLAAYATLYECLVTLAKLLAPFTPFLAEEMYQNLVRTFDAERGRESIHLTDWPVADAARIDRTLSEETRLVMRIASLGRAARAKAQLKVRQPVAELCVKLPTQAEEHRARTAGAAAARRAERARAAHRARRDGLPALRGEAEPQAARPEVRPRRAGDREGARIDAGGGAVAGRASGRRGAAGRGRRARRSRRRSCW